MMTTHVLNQPRRTEAQALADRLQSRIQSMVRAGVLDKVIADDLLAVVRAYLPPPDLPAKGVQPDPVARELVAAAAIAADLIPEDELEAHAAAMRAKEGGA